MQRNYFFPLAIIWLSTIFLTIISVGVDILEVRRTISQNQIYNLTQIIISSFAPIIFSKCITDKSKNYLKILIVISTPLATLLLASSSGLIAFSFSIFYYLIIFKRDSLPIISFKIFFKTIHTLIQKKLLKKFTY